MRGWRAAILAVPFALLGPLQALAQGAAVYDLVPAQSQAVFSVKSPIGGARATIGFVSGTVVLGPSGQVIGADATLDATTLEASNTAINKRLRGPKGFAVDEHRRVTFEATSVTQRGATITVHGDLTVRAITRPVTLEGTATGGAGAPLTLQLSGTIARGDFGITAGRPLYSRRANVSLSITAAPRR